MTRRSFCFVFSFFYIFPHAAISPQYHMQFSSLMSSTSLYLLFQCVILCNFLFSGIFVFLRFYCSRKSNHWRHDDVSSLTTEALVDAFSILFHVYIIQIYSWIHIIALILDFYTEWKQATVKNYIFTPKHIPKTSNPYSSIFIYTSTPRPRMSRESVELEEKERSKEAAFVKYKTYTAKNPRYIVSNRQKSLPGISQDTPAMSRVCTLV